MLSTLIWNYIFTDFQEKNKIEGTPILKLAMVNRKNLSKIS